MKNSYEVCEKWLEDKTVNPRTGKKITFEGPTYKALEEECDRKIGKSKGRKELVEQYTKHCFYDNDPISLVKFKDMTMEDLVNVVKIKFGDKYHCFDVDGLYGLISSTEEPVNPITRVPFSKADIAKIHRAYKKKSELIGRKYVKINTQDEIAKKQAQEMIDTGLNNDGDDIRGYIDALRETSEDDFIAMNGPGPYGPLLYEYMIWAILHGRV